MDRCFSLSIYFSSLVRGRKCLDSKVVNGVSVNSDGECLSFHKFISHLGKKISFYSTTTFLE